MPMLRQVPATWLIADSRETQFRSGSFVLAISSTCARVMVATLSLFGTPEPLPMFSALRMSVGVGGVLVIKVKLRSA